MRPIEREFMDKGVVHGGVFVLRPRDALDLVRRCREHGIRVLGLDAFRLTETTIQPVMEQSPDFSWPNDTDAWTRAESFLSERADTGLFFEVVCDQEHSIVTIYVPRLLEGAPAWRPVQAEHFYGDVYRIAAQPYDRSIEPWQFEPGETVLCEHIQSATGPIIAAVRRAAS